MVKSVDHISFVDIGEIFLLQYLDVQVLFSWKIKNILHIE